MIRIKQGHKGGEMKGNKEGIKVMKVDTKGKKDTRRERNKEIKMVAMKQGHEGGRDRKETRKQGGKKGNKGEKETRGN